jgi:hypothetical protein
MPDGDKGTAAAASAAPGSAAGSEGLLGRLSELAWRALPAIGSAIGFAGFVAIVGAAIDWIRFDAAHLPATQAVLAMPKQELVIEGARALIVFIVAAVLAVLLVYLIDSKGDATRQTARGLVVVGWIGLLVAVVLIRGHHKWSTYFLLIAALTWITLVAFYFVGLAMQDFRRRLKLRQAGARVVDALTALTSAADARDGADEAVSKSPSAANKTARAQAHGAAVQARSRFKRAVKEWASAADQVISLHRAASQRAMRTKRNGIAALAGASPGTVELKAKLGDAERALGGVFRAMLGQALEAWNQLRTVEVVVQVVVVCVGVAIFVSIAAGAAELPQQVLLLVLVVVLLTTMNIFVARATEKFAWYGISVFFSVLMFGAALTIAGTLEQPKVQPIALVRKDNETGTCGVYITQTSERVYVGRLPALGKRPGEIFWVPTSDVDLVSVGQPEKIGTRHTKRRFSAYAKNMLERLYEDRAEEAAPSLKNTKYSEEGRKPASKEQAQRIHGLHVVTNTVEREGPPKEVRSKARPHVRIDDQTCTGAQHVEPRRTK